MWFKKRKKKVFVIGLDCAPPRLLFEEFRDQLPHFKMMMERGAYSRPRSVHPPITVPAWMCMCSGKTPGEVGVYGFRSREGNSYTDYQIVTSHAFSKTRRIWDVLADYGKKSILVGVPPTYPPFPINGCMVSGFICPGPDQQFTYPPELKQEIEHVVGSYPMDVVFRTEDRDALLTGAWEMTNKRFDVIEYLLKSKPWDFFMFVEIGVDRIQHAFWKYYDQKHHKYEAAHTYKDVIFDYYKLIDERVGKILKMLDQDTVVFTVSDHGAKAMMSSFCLNEWLIKKGYLVLNSYPAQITRFEKLDVNWDKTVAWGWGGYYGRIFINKQDREEKGVVSDSDYEALRDRLITELEAETDASGKPWKTKVYKPQTLYENPQGDVSDLMAYFDDLSYRSAGTVGHNKLFLDENDTGPDDAMHDWEAVFIQYDPSRKGKGMQPSMSILELKSRVLEAMGIVDRSASS